MSPEYVLFGVAVLIVILSSHWRRSRLRRAVRDLSTPARRQLGPEPEFEPPAGAATGDLQAFAALHRRTKRIQHVCWGLALLWLAYVLVLLSGGTAP
ncbi:hypothetical protein [Pseudoponticoccus marisrubri]|nr:hypothetical protein [Pseudoponticoccus marisrubri]